MGIHEPALPTARLLADALSDPLIYLYCEDDHIASLLLALHRLSASERQKQVRQFISLVDAG